LGPRTVTLMGNRI